VSPTHVEVLILADSLRYAIKGLMGEISVGEALKQIKKLAPEFLK
jgi:hypothetical protein